MRPLIIDAKAKKEIKRVIEYAEKNIVIKDVIEQNRQDNIAVGNDFNRVCFLTMGFRIVYSIDKSLDDLYRHISVSVDDSKKMPSVPAVEMIMHEFGFKGNIHDQFLVWTENNVKLPTGEIVSAVNVMASIDTEKQI